MIKIQVVKIRNVLVGTILEQDDNIISYSDEFRASNGFKIVSRRIPEFGDDMLFLRGELKEEDERVFVRRFDTQKEADKYLEKLKVAIAEFNKKEQTISSEILF